MSSTTPETSSQELHDGREDADHGRRGDDGQVAADHLPEQYGQRGK